MSCVQTLQRQVPRAVLLLLMRFCRGQMMHCTGLSSSRPDHSHTRASCLAYPNIPTKQLDDPRSPCNKICSQSSYVQHCSVKRPTTKPGPMSRLPMMAWKILSRSFDREDFPRRFRKLHVASITASRNSFAEYPFS